MMFKIVCNKLLHILLRLLVVYFMKANIKLISSFQVCSQWTPPSWPMLVSSWLLGLWLVLSSTSLPPTHSPAGDHGLKMIICIKIWHIVEGKVKTFSLSPTFNKIAHWDCIHFTVNVSLIILVFDWLNHG